MLPKLKKETIVDNLSRLVSKASLLVVLKNNGLINSEAVKLRRTLHKMKSNATMARNTLLRRAFDQVGIAYPQDVFSGSVFIICATENFTTVAKSIKKLVEKDLFNIIAVQAIAVESIFLPTKNLKEVVNLPTKEGVLGRLLYGLQYPICNIQLSLLFPLYRLFVVLSLIVKK